MGDWPRCVPAASPRKAALRSNAHCEQSNHADPDHQHGECYGSDLTSDAYCLVKDTVHRVRTLLSSLLVLENQH